MLVLSRKCEESIIINDDIEIKVVEIMGDKVRIGIEAPKKHRVLRSELVPIIENNKESLSSNKSQVRDFMSDFKNLQKSKENKS